MKNRPAAFLDRDGVLNVDKGYVYKIKDYDWIPGAKESIKYLNSLNYFVFIVSNQSGISRGYYSQKDLEILNNYINNDLAKVGAYIDEFFFSPYHPDYHSKFPHLSHLRKPNSGMLQLAFEKWNFDKNSSFMIGDSESDIKCAENFGIKSHLFKSGNLYSFIKNIEIREITVS